MKSSLWHPCTRVKAHEIFPPLSVKSALGSYIELSDGRKIIDAISSWWCKSLGHNHPRLQNALLKQMQKFEHVMLGSTTNKLIELLSYKLAKIEPNLSKVFYAGDGSSAVEIALKMCVHARKIQYQNNRNKFISLANSYHGETVGALSVSDVGLYRAPYSAMLFQPAFISSVPYVSGVDDPLWHDCSSQWSLVERQLESYASTATAIIVEPIIQGAGGMRVYSADFLRRLKNWASKNNIYLIADEIMTGIGRTGKMLACQHAGIIPDFLCVGKGLTSGWLPLSAVLTSSEIYELFYEDSFLHSHTYSGNALAASVALEVLNIMNEERVVEAATVLGKYMRCAMEDVGSKTGRIKNIRSIGAIVAADIICEDAIKTSIDVSQKAAALGALIRPLGNTLYWLPPLNTKLETIDELKYITIEALK